MTTPQTIFGQADAVAVELAEALNGATFSLSVSAARSFVRKTEVGELPEMDDPVDIQIIPVHEQEERIGISGQYDDLYGVHIVMQRHVGADAETQVPLLLRLRSEIIELLCGTTLSTTAAVHGFSGAHVQQARNGPKGLYDLERLEGLNCFYSDIIVTYKAAALRRRT